MMTDRTSFIKCNMGGKILDVGCSYGLLHQQISNDGVFGLDIKIGKYTKNFIKGNAQFMPFKDNSFDTLVCGELIEHLKNPEKFLKECRRTLKMGGTLILTTPNKNSWVNKLLRSSFLGSHVSLFDIKTFKETVSKYFRIKQFFCLPYDEISSSGSKHRKFYWLRGLVHRFLPEGLQEEMIIKGINNK